MFAHLGRVCSNSCVLCGRGLLTLDYLGLLMAYQLTFIDRMYVVFRGIIYFRVNWSAKDYPNYARKRPILVVVKGMNCLVIIWRGNGRNCGREINFPISAFRIDCSSTSMWMKKLSIFYKLCNRKTISNNVIIFDVFDRPRRGRCITIQSTFTIIEGQFSEEIREAGCLAGWTGHTTS